MSYAQASVFQYPSGGADVNHHQVGAVLNDLYRLQADLAALKIPSPLLADLPGDQSAAQYCPVGWRSQPPV
ncbi:MAG: hypothetical protein QNI95_14085 [Desulfobacterales bacterium]|nr:hypothetical protein [Desulfobacterales bacterium]